jgi:uncharacterized delta-60 repeat protein
MIGVLVVPGGFYLSRYDTNGNLDLNFCCGGTPTIIPGIIGTPGVLVAIQNNDNIVVQVQGAGLVPPPQNGVPPIYHTIIAFTRFNNNGVLDSSFGTNGIVVEDYQDFYGQFGPFPPQGVALGIQSDGKIVDALHFGHRNFSNFRLGRLNSNGIRDSSFLRYINVQPFTLFSDLVIGKDDAIVIAGSTAGGRFSPQFLLLGRFNGDGMPDSSFRFPGATNPYINLRATAAAVQSDGKILVSSEQQLLRFHTDGRIDSSFGINGIVNTGVRGFNIILQDNGKIIVGADRIVRLHPNGTVDVSFGNNGFISAPQGWVYNMSISGNRLYVYGSGVLAAYQLTIICAAPTFLNNEQIVLNASCGKSDGNVSIIPISGTAPFMYSKDGGANYFSGPDGGYTFDNLSVGTYNLRLKDATGCESAIVQREVRSVGCTTCTAPTFLNNDQIVLNANCGANDGNLSIIPINGTAPFMYSIDGGANYISGADGGYTFENLPAGLYQLRLKDATGCESAVIQREIQSIGCPSCTPPTFLNNDQIVLAASCGNSDGNVSIIPITGSAPFMYSINGGSTYITGSDGGYTFENLAAGVYQLRLKDATGCQSAVIQREVTNRTNCTSIAATSNLSDVTISPVKGTITTYPNPSRGQFKLQLQNFTASRAEILVFDGRGSVIHKRAVNITDRSTFDFDLTGRAKGIYYIKILSKNGTKFSKVILH